MKVSPHHEENNQTSVEDIRLWRGLQQGDKKAYSQIYAKYCNELYNYVSKLSKEKELVKDCIQDLFIELWRNRAGLGDANNVKHYLYKSIRRKVKYKMTLNQRLPSAGDAADFEIELIHKSHYLTFQIDAEVREQISSLINTLTPKQKEAIFLIYFEELTYEEAAQIMELKVKTLYNLVHLAISKLRERRNDISSMLLTLFL